MCFPVNVGFQQVQRSEGNLWVGPHLLLWDRTGFCAVYHWACQTNWPVSFQDSFSSAISLLEQTVSSFSFLRSDLRWSCMYGKRYWAPQLWKLYILIVYYFKDILPKEVFFKVSGIIFMRKREKKPLMNCGNTTEENKLWRCISATVPHWRDSHVYTTATPPDVWPGSAFTEYFPLSRWVKINK